MNLSSQADRTNVFRTNVFRSHCCVVFVVRFKALWAFFTDIVGSEPQLQAFSSTALLSVNVPMVSQPQTRNQKSNLNEFCK